MEELKFESLPISKTSELIEKEIEKAILIKRLKPGDKLPTEKKMAEQFGVSLVTLREALRGLEIFGLIEKRKGQRGGVFISEIDNQSIKGSLGHFLSFKELSPQHLYEVRRIIEPPAIKLAVQKISPDEIRKLEENVSYCEGMLNGMGQQINVQQFYALDDRNNDFHRLIAAGSHNPILSLTVDYVLDFLKGCETTFLVPDIKYSMDNVQDHKNILGYLKKRDAEMCEKEMILHLKKLDEYLIALESKQIGNESNLYGLNDR